MRLATWLVSHNLMTLDQANEVMHEQRQQTGHIRDRFGRIAVKKGYISEEALTRAYLAKEGGGKRPRSDPGSDPGVGFLEAGKTQVGEPGVVAGGELRDERHGDARPARRLDPRGGVFEYQRFPRGKLSARRGP